MTDSHSDFEESIRSISENFDDVFASASQSVNPDFGDADYSQTVFVPSIKDEGGVKSIELKFDGENAPIIARPVHSIIAQFFDADRFGGSDKDRTIRGNADHASFTSAGAALKRFQEAAQNPANKQAIEEFIAVSLKVEQKDICKVMLKFNTKDDSVTPVVDHIIASSNSSIAQGVSGNTDVNVRPYGDWKTSDMTPQSDGVYIKPLNSDGQSALQDLLQSIASEALPRPTQFPRLENGGDN